MKGSLLVARIGQVAGWWGWAVTWIGLFMMPCAKQVLAQSEYSRLFAEVQILHQAGKHADALRHIPAIYEEEIPVDSFYVTLERTREQILADLMEAGSFRVGEKEFRCDRLKHLLVVTFLPRPDILRYRDMEKDGEAFPLERYLYLFVVAGKEPIAPAKGSLLEPAAPLVDLKAALQSMDPWLVSAALNLDGWQGESGLEAQAVIDRWQARPDLWDEDCTSAARRLFARLSPEEVAKLEAKKESEAWTAIESLEAVPENRAEVRLHFFRAQSGDGLERRLSPDRVTLRLLERKKRPPGQVVQRFEGDPGGGWMMMEKETKEIDLSAFENDLLVLAPGSYQVKFVADGIYGESMVFDAATGHFTVVPVSVNFGI